MVTTKLKKALNIIALAFSAENTYGLTPLYTYSRKIINYLPVALRLRPKSKQPFVHIFATHHKTGHHLCGNIARAYSRKLLLNYYDLSGASKFPKSADVIIYESNLGIDHSTEHRQPSYGSSISIQNMTFKGIHIIRHPYEVIASGYRWHKKIDRPWVKREWKNTGKSYQEHLFSEDGLAFEMRNVSRDVIMNMYNFPFADKRFITLKLEDFQNNYRQAIVTIAHHLEIPEDIILHTSAPFDINSMSKLPRYVTKSNNKEASHISLFKPHHYDLFNDIFPPDVFTRLGYEGHSQSIK
jgi:hypothetical protein